MSGNIQRIQVDLSIYPVAVVQLAAHRLWPKLNCELMQPCGLLLPVKVAPVDDGSPEEAEKCFFRELMKARIYYQAHLDSSAVRQLLTQAAFSANLPSELLIEQLQSTIPDLPVIGDIVMHQGRAAIRRHWVDGRRILCELLPSCPIDATVRALSRLHDVSDSVCTGRNENGDILLTVTLGEDVDAGWWMDQFASLLAVCQTGALSAVYPPRQHRDQFIAGRAGRGP